MTTDVKQLQAQVDQATTLSRETGLGFTEAMMLVQRGGELGEPVTPEHVNPTYLGLLEDRQRLDEVVRVLEADLDLDYLGALEYLERRFSQWEFASAEAREAVTLAQVLDGTPVTLSRVLTAAREQGPEITALAQSIDTPKPSGEVIRHPDGSKNVVKYPGTVDLDELVADPLNAKRAYRTAQAFQNGQSMWERVPGLVTVDEFNAMWEDYAARGYDLVESLKLWQHEAELAEAQDDAVTRREIEAKVETAVSEGQLKRGDLLKPS